MTVTTGRAAGMGESGLDIEDRMIRTKLLMDGEFKEQTQAMRDERTKLENLQGIVATQTEANALKVEAGEHKAQAQAALDAAKKAVDDANAEAAKVRQTVGDEVKALGKKNTLLKVREDAAQAREEAVTRAEAQIPVTLASRTQALDARDAEMLKREQRCNEREAYTADLKKRVEDRIKMITAPI